MQPGGSRSPVIEGGVFARGDLGGDGQREEVPVPEYGINDVLIEVLRTGICGTDLHIYQWDAWSQGRVKLPCIIGHEFAGEVVAVGPGVRHVKVGDNVKNPGAADPRPRTRRPRRGGPAHKPTGMTSRKMYECCRFAPAGADPSRDY